MAFIIKNLSLVESCINNTLYVYCFRKIKCSSFVKKGTLNKVADCDRYPVPGTEDLFAILSRGGKYSELDLSYAYQQFILAPF